LVLKKKKKHDLITRNTYTHGIPHGVMTFVGLGSQAGGDDWSSAPPWDSFDMRPKLDATWTRTQ
jgi:hypothetical protein